ncbi:5-dehydro-4-deoxyglucarate dehydratase [Zhihengliuella salsuginis]|uniref:Probable 5-dehydro-4-deoxyglucarate dehydratase n=1 Tax=Zhihengliuella salsuginis TaxID=578222 RepID=A0ABQ3GFD2_9MICC|nr:5-dehydro-4-deoxyglucarate dehydratase [Zhihengliuella salsuginis]GHD02232.1 putative 5-dehydro-4-deoxyglucarate dehydratase [Zhihengliuella salsuginis]
MTQYSPAELAARLKDGLLSFPVTAFDADLNVDEEAYRRHLDWQAGFDVAGLFAAGGTGEGFSLSPEESARVVAMAVEEAGDRTPVLASAGGATCQAVENARAAEAAGAEGLLLLPPYLTECDQQGLLAHANAVCAATNVSVIVYNRANAIYSAETVAALADRHPNFIGFKDATGDIEAVTRVVAKNGDRLFYLGGLPTAETFALPMLQLGMSTYSSAMFNFVPEFALEFYADVRRQDRVAVTEKLNRFVLPYLDIRDRVKGYGVSIVKAGLQAVGRDAGSVRPPLQDLTERDAADLSALIEAAGIRPSAAALQNA